MDSSSRIEKKNIEDDDNYFDKTVLNLYTYEYEKSNYKEIKNYLRNNLLKVKLIALKEKALNRHSSNRLFEAYDYLNNLCKEDLKNYKNLVNYCKNTNVFEDEIYMVYGDYCDNYHRLVVDFIDDVYDRVCNKAIVLSIMETEDKENDLKNSNKYLIPFVKQKGSKIKVKSK
ncbi:MAG: hypothetical protein IKH54_01825 [Bacilli bacterium]|nr:hypothetical protein [Bacilli bacterium]